jgi:hypothetical protein
MRQAPWWAGPGARGSRNRRHVKLLAARVSGPGSRHGGARAAAATEPQPSGGDPPRGAGAPPLGVLHWRTGADTARQPSDRREGAGALGELLDPALLAPRGPDGFSEGVQAPVQFTPQHLVEALAELLAGEAAGALVARVDAA